MADKKTLLERAEEIRSRDPKPDPLYDLVVDIVKTIEPKQAKAAESKKPAGK